MASESHVRDDAVFFPRGRDALYHACQAFGIGPGDCVLAPALICRSAADPMLAAGATVHYIDVAADLDYNQQLLDAAFIQYRPKAILAVHYFGRCPRLERYRALCDEYGATLIEDRCHSLPAHMSGGLDILGDCAVYSLRKFLPVPDGGVLILRKPGMPVPKGHRAISFGAYFKFLLRRLGEPLLYSGMCNPYAFRRGAHMAPTDAAQLESISYAAPQRNASVFLQRWLNAENLCAAVDKQGNNSRRLAALLSVEVTCPPPGEFSPLDAAPRAFPILDLSPEADLVARLRASGIGAYSWPGNELPAAIVGKYPEAERLARQLVLLPVHYDLTEADLSYVAKTVQELVKQGNAL